MYLITFFFSTQKFLHSPPDTMKSQQPQYASAQPVQKQHQAQYPLAQPVQQQQQQQQNVPHQQMPQQQQQQQQMPQQQYMQQQHVVMQPAVYGGCPHAIQTSEFTICGVILAVVFFPIGLLCCFLMQETHCTQCRAILG